MILYKFYIWKIYSILKKDNNFQKIKRVFKIVKLRGNQSHLIVKLKNKNIKSLKNTVLIIIILLSLECGHWTLKYA